MLTGNYNAIKDVESEHYDQIREFMSLETDAFIVSATLNHFGTNDPDDVLVLNKPPQCLKKASYSEKRTWLHNQIDVIFDKYISDCFSSLSKTKKSIELVTQTAKEKTRLPCRSADCARTFVYTKCRLNHEKEVHGIVTEDSMQFPSNDEESRETEDKEKEDFIFNYGCLHIALGVMLRNAEDSVKEGDGERLIRVWKFLTYIFRMKGHNKYALAGLRIIASVEGLLTPRQAHRLTWNRFAGRKEGRGTRISRDLRVEQINKISKEEIRALGFPNINEESVVSATRATSAIDEMQQQTKQDLGMSSRSGHHSNKRSIKTFQCILEQIHRKVKMFQFTPGREFLVSPNLGREIFANLSPKSLQSWIKKHRNRWHKQNIHRYNIALPK